jgi:hypothetical protein
MPEPRAAARSTRRAPWTRRALYPSLSRWIAVLGLVVAGAFLTGRVLTDTRHWSQYLYWVPILWTLIACWVLLLVSALLGWRGLRPKGHFVRALLMLMCLGMTLFALVFVWRVHRPVLRLVSAPPEPDLRVIHWNIAADSFDTDAAARSILAQSPDIALIANARWDGQRAELLDALALPTPDPESSTTTPTLIGSLLIATNHALTHSTVAWLDPSADPDTNTRPTGDRGWIVLLAFEIPDRSAPFVVWVVDLPSEPTQWRADTIARALRAATRPDLRIRAHTDAPAPDFTSPDLIIGDFNTPRASASLARFGTLAPAPYTDAFGDTGWGRARSWTPRPANPLARAAIALADWHIDLALVHPDHTATDYALFAPVPADHRAQRVDLRLAPATPPAPSPETGSP